MALANVFKDCCISAILCWNWDNAAPQMMYVHFLISKIFLYCCLSSYFWGFRILGEMCAETTFWMCKNSAHKNATLGQQLWMHIPAAEQGI